MGRVYQRKRDRGRPGEGTKLSGWWAQWTDEHGRRLKRRAGDTRREAKAYLAEREAEVARAKRRPGWERTAGSVRLGAFLTDYIGKMVRGRLKDARGRERQLLFWRDALGPQVELSRVSPSAVEGVLAELRAGGASGATCNRYLAALRHALNTATGWGLLPASPIQRVRQRPEDGERTRVISAEEEARLLAAAGQSRNRALAPLIVVALETCARPDELLRLRWADIDRERRLVTFRKTKAGRTREVPLTRRALDALDQIGGGRPGEAVFTYRGEPLRDVRAAFRSACETAGIPYGTRTEGGLVFRDTRRTAITRLAERGVPAAIIQRWSGHETLAMVQRYTAVSDEAVRAVADAMDEARSGPTSVPPGS